MAMNAPTSIFSAPRRLEVLDLPLDLCESLAATVAAIAPRFGAGVPFLTTFVNPAAVATSRRTRGFKALLAGFDLVLPDGIGMSAAVEWLEGRDVARVSFDSTSLAPPVLKIAEDRGLTVALVGGAPGIAERAAEQLRQAFPSLKITGALDGYGDRTAKLAAVRDLDPQIVICGMGGVAQEEFLRDLVDVGWRGCGFTCGGYLDQLGNGLQYYPAWIDRTNLRFLYRLAKEPRRLWRRYLLDYPVFGGAVLREAVGRAFSSVNVPDRTRMPASKA
jgi:N-acetylglucosaminyldiphosphoundecaprenol N-acetyl-beta-D-mannosaminyltransferase